MSKEKFGLVIFDCDGVLVDSELITNRVFAQMLNELGIAISVEDMFERFVGRSMPQCLEIVTKLLGRPVPRPFIEEYQTRTATALKAELRAVPDIETVLAAMRIPYCVASSGTHEKMHTTLGITGLLPRFRGKMYSVTEVAQSKPFPDVFLHAARQQGVMPADCAVIEDTPTGVRAGVAAGMTVFGYCGLTPKQRLIDAGAHHTFERMRDLPGLISSAA
ncbi:MAG TPA: HAD family hydrolase [Steroidobacteraceae bacterium]|jgi:HAD superfamily hydrolase (TIGR01509 family)|nr:HAD family hydrolase [Steroidobacteraceae bacterium]